MLKERFGQVLSFLAIVGICTINYGWGIDNLGIHADDWFWFTEYYFGGFLGVVAYGAVDRLLIGVPFGLLGEFVGLHPAFWHAIIVTLHICVVLLVWRLLLFWVEDNLFSMCIAALFAIYPSVSVVVWISRLPSILSLTLFLLSLLLSISATTRPAYWRFLQILALLLAPISLLMYELPLVLEPIRLLLMLHESREQHVDTRNWVGKSFLRWLPFATMWLLFLVWRLWLTQYILPKSRGLGNGWPGITSFVSGEARGFYQILAYSWKFVLERLVEARFSWQPWVLATLASLLVLFVGIELNKKTNFRQKSIHLSVIIAGAGIVFSGISIPVAAGFPVPTPVSLSTRVNSVAVIGASMIIVGAISWGTQSLQIKSNVLPVLSITVLVGLGTANNYLVNENYIQSWNRQQDLWWQIAWRAPKLKAGTYLLIGSRESLSDLDNGQPPPWGINNPLAFIYGEKSYGGEYLDRSTIVRLKPDGLEPILGTELISPEQLLVAYYGDGCLKFADSERSVQDVDDSLFVTMAPLSNLDNILAGGFDRAGAGLREIVNEPSQDWCFYYQQATYFAQYGNWVEVTRLLKEAQFSGFSPTNTIEWAPFIEAYLHLGDEAQVIQLLSMIQDTPMQRQDALRACLESVTKQAQDEGNLDLANLTRSVQASYLP